MINEETKSNQHELWPILGVLLQSSNLKEIEINLKFNCEISRGCFCALTKKEKEHKGKRKKERCILVIRVFFKRESDRAAPSSLDSEFRWPKHKLCARQHLAVAEAWTCSRLARLWHEARMCSHWCSSQVQLLSRPFFFSSHSSYYPSQASARYIWWGPLNYMEELREFL